ncbi:hypothetical protein [Croceitalea sp. P059]|uniref:hypothetical protein n=1 Tax=Croceitalea sp. P059 TaxID=3075601 RepID=UPI00288819FC|nr:hypothetical protein [Croceitalea sp. P059]MDT0540647.1 hypothetical protein [Croceitalea sp. P059]
MKNFKIESFIYLCFFIAAATFYQSTSIQSELDKNVESIEISKNQFEDAMADAKDLEVGDFK